MNHLSTLLRYFLPLVFLFVISGCVSTKTARVYNLETGDVLTASYLYNGTGHGQISLTMKDGTQLTGEYTTISGMGMSTGFGTANAYGSGGYAWAIAQGFSFNQPGKQFGSAIVAGHGLVIDLVYVTDPWTGHGYGVGKDNKGVRYKVQF